MKNFLRFYLVFSLIVVSFSCSDDDSDLEESNSVEYEVTRYSNSSIPDEVVPKVTYNRLADGFLISGYFQNNNLGNPERLLALVLEDGINNPVVVTFSPTGKLNSIYEHEPINGEVFFEDYVSNSDGVTYYGSENDVFEINGNIPFDYSAINFVNSIDLMIMEAIDNNMSILESFNYELNNDDLNRQVAISGAGLAAIIAAIGALIALDAIINSDKVKSVQRDLNAICNPRLSNTSRINQSSNFLCSQLQALLDKIKENSDMEIDLSEDLPPCETLSFCYGNEANLSFSYPTRNYLLFNSGRIETGFDELRVYSGGILQYAGTGNAGDLTGLVFGGNGIRIELTSDGSVSCQSSDNFVPISYSVCTN